MRKKLAVLAPLLAVMAFAVIPAAAQAVPHWYKKNVLIGSGPVPVATAGALTFTALGTTIKCKVKDTEEIWNPASGGPGQDLMTAFQLVKCKSAPGNSACPKGNVEMFANGLPWPSVLVTEPGPPPVIRDEIKKVRLQLRCIPGTVGDEFEGTLSPEVVGNNLVFGPGSGTLTDASLNPMTVAGKDKLIAPPGKVTAKDP
jgi:hypothetical protein